VNDQGPDRFARHDAVYLLGALAPEERQEYVDHLRTCATCSRSVADLAGLPGLLARVPPDLLPELGSEVVDEPPPTLLPTLLVEVQRTSRRRHRWALAGGVAAAAAVVAVLALGTLGAMRTPSPSSTSTPPTVTAPALTLAPVAATPIRATAQLQPVAWGTRIVLRCTYAAGDRPCNVVVSADLSHLPDSVTEVVLMNELGADIFSRYVDSDGADLRGAGIGAWNQVRAATASFVAEQSGVSFTLDSDPDPDAPGVRLYRGREKARGRLAWAGFGYSLRPGPVAITYTLRIARGEVPP